MKTLLIAAVFFSSIVWVSGQDGMDYTPKRMIKELTQFESGFRDELVQIPLDNNQGIYQGGQTERLYKINIPIQNIQYVFVGRVSCCRKGGCDEGATRRTLGEAYEFFDYYIFFDKTGTIRHLAIFNYEATHGQEITSRGWLKQFVGYNGTSPLVVGKNVDALSGATVSVNALVLDLQKKVEALKRVLGW